jgi:hypothetical protein
LAYAYKRGAALRRRRITAVVVAIGAAVTVAISVPIALASDTNPPTPHVAIATTTSGALPESSAPTTVPATTSTEPTPDSTPNTSPPSPTSPTEITPTPTPTPTPPPTPPVFPACDTTEITVSNATAFKPQYAPGEDIVITFEVRNVSQRTCAAPGQMVATFTNSAHAVIATLYVIADFPAGLNNFDPGTVWHSSVPAWSQQCSQTCTGNAPPGVYTASITVSSGVTYGPATTTFAIA